MKLKEEGTKVMFALIRLGKSCMHVLLRLASIETKGRKRRRRLRRRGSAVPGGRQMGPRVLSSHCLGWRERLRVRGDLFSDAEIFRKFRTRAGRG